MTLCLTATETGEVCKGGIVLIVDTNHFDGQSGSSLNSTLKLKAGVVKQLRVVLLTRAGS